MSILRSIFAQHEAKAALGVWALIPTIFLFFAITLAVDPSTQLGKVKLGVAVLDTGVQTPQGQVSIGSKLVGGLHEQVPVQVVQFTTEEALRNAVFAHEVSGGIVFPENMTQNLQTQQPVQMRVIKSDANDPFTSAFMTNISTQLSSNLNAALPALLGGQATPPLVSASVAAVATTTDFRFGTIPASMLLPIWVGTLAFCVLLSRATDRVRHTLGVSAMQTGTLELGISAIGSAITAAVIVLDMALFTWRWDLDFVALFGFLWVGLLASAWLIQGTIRLLGFELGSALGLIALFVQQPVSGAGFPSAFAPDVVRWATDVSPLRYMVEGLRNILIGGSTTSNMAFALVLLAGAGLVIYAGGVARLSFMPSRQSPPQTVQA